MTSSDGTHYWIEDKLEPRVGRVAAIREAFGSDTLKIEGCTPLVGDWIRVRNYDALVVKAEGEGWFRAFRFHAPWHINEGETVTIIGEVFAAPRSGANSEVSG